MATVVEMTILSAFVIVVALATVKAGQQTSNQNVRGSACSSNFCSSYTCKKPNIELCVRNGLDFRPKGTSCSCCDACLAFIPVGGVCSLWESESTITYSAQCQPPANCVNGTCVSRQQYKSASSCTSSGGNSGGSSCNNTG